MNSTVSQPCLSTSLSWVLQRLGQYKLGRIDGPTSHSLFQLCLRISIGIGRWLHATARVHVVARNWGIPVMVLHVDNGMRVRRCENVVGLPTSAECPVGDIRGCRRRASEACVPTKDGMRNGMFESMTYEARSIVLTRVTRSSTLPDVR